MRHGLLRSLSALLSGTAFAVSVAGPVQLDPCPEHGVGVVSVAATMEMPAGEEMPVVHVPAEGAHGHHAAGHLCTCPGGCCGSSPVGLRIGAIETPVATVALHASAPSHPTAAIAFASSPQLRLPPANAPPALRALSQGAAHHST